MGRIIVGFKDEDEVNGERVGKVFVYEEEDPDTFLEKVRWMSFTEAQALAKERGYDFEEEW